MQENSESVGGIVVVEEERANRMHREADRSGDTRKAEPFWILIKTGWHAKLMQLSYVCVITAQCSAGRFYFISFIFVLILFLSSLYSFVLFDFLSNKDGHKCIEVHRDYVGN